MGRKIVTYNVECSTRASSSLGACYQLSNMSRDRQNY
jgi:hypothetical protein